MMVKKLTVKKGKTPLFLHIDANQLIIKDKNSILYDIDLDKIENIKVERIVNQIKNHTYEVNIKGNFIELAKISLHRTQAFKLQRWLEDVLEQKKKYIFVTDPEVRYRPTVFHPDWIDSIWQVGAIMVILALLCYIFFIGLPGIKHSKTKENDARESYQYFLEEGKRLVELDRLTEGINYLEDAKAAKNTQDVQTLLDAAYLERAEFYFQNKEFVKTLRDLQMIQTPTKKSEQLVASSTRLANSIAFLSTKTIQSIQNLLDNRWDLNWNKTVNQKTGMMEWDGKKYDGNSGIIYSCFVIGRKEDQLAQILLKTELMQKDITTNDGLFEQISQDFLGICSQLTDVKEDQLKINQWFSQWYPKVATSNYQIKEKIADMGFILMSEKGVRFLEINISEEKTPPQ